MTAARRARRADRVDAQPRRDVLVYEATVKPLLYLPQIGHMWRKFARQAEVVEIVGTHISMMHEPYVESLANDMRKRIDAFFSTKS